jgi:hypothetical protein
VRTNAADRSIERHYLAVMIDVAAFTAPPVWAYRPALQDRVRVDDGREGTVVGFYRREREGVLVAFAGGESAEFPVPALEPA